MINSPNYPSEYGDNTICSWNLLAPIGRRLTINQFSYRIEPHASCKYDGLEIYDGPDEDDMIVRVCGPGTYQDVQSTGNALFLRFYSDGSEDYKGFQIHYALMGN